MKIEEVLPAFREGRCIRRKMWHPEHYIESSEDPTERDFVIIHLVDPEEIHDLEFETYWLDILADDWEFLE